MPQFSKNKWFRIAAVVALLIGLYALAGFWLAPKLVRNALMKDIPRTVGLAPAVGEIHINPFLFQVELKNFSLTDSGGEKLLGFERLFVDFELSSIWHRAYTFSNIDIGKPFVNAIVAKDGRLNLLELEPKSTPAPPPKKPSEKDAVPALRIGSLKVGDGLVSYDDRSTPSGFGARLQPINFELRDFTTGVEGGRFTFTGVSKVGERIEWHGHVSVQPIESDGEFQIDGLQAHTLWDYLEDKLNFVINSGKLNLNSTYKFALKDRVDLQVDLQNISLTDLTVRPLQGDQDWVSLPQLVVKDTHVDLAQRQVQVDDVALTGLKLVTWLDKGGAINLMSLAAPRGEAPPAAAKPPPPTVAVTQSAVPTDTPWKVGLRKFELHDADISAEDRSIKPAAQVELAKLTVTVEGASLDLSKPLAVSLDTKINGKGGVSLSGKLTPQPLNADLNVKLDGVELSAAQPYIGQFTSMTLRSGALSGDTQLHYAAGKPELGLSGNLSVAKLNTIDNALRRDFITWDQLDVQGLNYQHNPDRLDVNLVTAQKAYARVIIEPDSSLNVERVLAGPGATLVAPAEAGSTAGPVTVTAPATSSKPQAPRPSGNKANQKKAAPPATTRKAPMMPISVKKILLKDSEADFADLTVMPNFSAGIQKMNGTVTGLSSKEGARAKIDIKGQVDPFAPVTIKGELNVLSAVLYADVALDFRNIELSTFNPYSGKFAGYNIAKGKLTTELHYKVDDRKLDAQHHIVVDQLEFGDKTESKDAVSLPIKLAVSLLKDRNGVIDLNLPVQGTLDDPKFKLGPIIWKVFVNILEKAVTAPFALLGSLFGGGPDLQFIDFDPGAAEVGPGATDKVNSIVKALNERPQLKIEVPIAVVKDLDGPALAAAQLNLKTQAVRDAAGGKKPTAAQPFDQLEPAARLEILLKVYRLELRADAKFPDQIAAIKSKPDQIAAELDFLNGELHSHLKVSETDFTALGEARAANVQRMLLKDTQLDPARVFLVVSDKAKNEAGKVRLELSLR